MEKNVVVEKMRAVTELLLDKTESRMKKETKLSRKTLKMISLSEKLFCTFRSWGG